MIGWVCVIPDLCPRGCVLDPRKAGKGSSIAQKAEPFPAHWLQCARATMETLTLARFLCEMTLQEYDYARESPSKLAASCLLLALTMKNLGGWVSTVPAEAPWEALQGDAMD